MLGSLPAHPRPTAVFTTLAVLAGSLIIAATAAAPALAADANCPTASGALSGTGSSGDPYLVQSQGDLQLLKDDTFTTYSASANYLQTANIDMQVTAGTDCTWDRAITAFTSAGFTGTYDGGGFEISGLVVTPTRNYAGLFEIVSGTILDLGFTGRVTSAQTAGTYRIGGLVGHLYGGTITNSYTTGDVTSAYTDNNSPGTGGLVGYASNAAQISNSHSTGAVSAAATAGGLVGSTGANSPNVEILESYATGDVEATVRGGTAGGLVGRLVNATVTRSYATGDVSGVADAQHLGGLLGTMTNSTIIDSFATGGVSGWTQSTSTYGQVGGLFGDGTGAGSNTLTRTYSATISGMAPSSGSAFSNVGGVAGVLASTTWNSVAWNSQTAPLVTNPVGGTASVSGVTSFTTSQMTAIDTYTDPTGLDWNSGGSTTIADGYDATYTWGICSAVNNGYPFLTAIYSSDPCSSPSPTPSNGGSTAPPMTFSYYLPDGQQCTSISPQVVVNRTRVTLPGADAECRTPGSTISGWTIAGQDWAFTPGYSVYVVASQSFTAVLNEPTATIVLDANVKAADACIAEVDGRASNVAPADRTQILHLDRPDMDEYPEGERPSLATYPAPTVAPCTPPGYTLVSWNTRGDGSGNTIETGSPFDPAINDDDPNSDRNTVRFYAMWEEQQEVVSTSASAFFADTSSEFTQPGLAKLNSLLAAIPSTATNVTVSVIGSSVSLETVEANQRLAKQRSDELARETRELGVTGEYVVSTADAAMRAWLGGQPVPLRQSTSDPQISADGKPLSTVTITYQSR